MFNFLFFRAERDWLWRDNPRFKMFVCASPLSFFRQLAVFYLCYEDSIKGIFTNRGKRLSRIRRSEVVLLREIGVRNRRMGRRFIRKLLKGSWKEIFKFEEEGKEVAWNGVDGNRNWGLGRKGYRDNEDEEDETGEKEVDELKSSKEDQKKTVTGVKNRQNEVKGQEKLSNIGWFSE
jgi:hypothetical protein